MYLNHFAVHQKLPQHCKSTVFQLKRRVDSLVFYSRVLVQKALVEQLLYKRVWEMKTHPGLFPVFSGGEAAYIKATDCHR